MLVNELRPLGLDIDSHKFLRDGIGDLFEEFAEAAHVPEGVIPPFARAAQAATHGITEKIIELFPRVEGRLGLARFSGIGVSALVVCADGNFRYSRLHQSGYDAKANDGEGAVQEPVWATDFEQAPIEITDAPLMQPEP